jgi:Ring hydroxylating alpha subunit (catalytic domain)
MMVRRDLGAVTLAYACDRAAWLCGMWPCCARSGGRPPAVWDTVNREDIEIVERVQQGLETRPFPGGRLCYRFEEPLNRFHNMVADRMVGRRRIPPGDEAEEIPIFGARA